MKNSDSLPLKIQRNGWNKNVVVLLMPLFVFMFFAHTMIAQPIPFKFSQEDYMLYTGDYEGERFPDGRPKVSKDILDRMKKATIEEVWGVLRNHGYNSQFEQGWVMTHENPVLVGRAVTCSFIPHRPDVADVPGLCRQARGAAGHRRPEEPPALARAPLRHGPVRTGFPRPL